MEHAERHPVGGVVLTKITPEDEYYVNPNYLKPYLQPRAVRSALPRYYVHNVATYSHST
jgi:hypothetical protein